MRSSLGLALCALVLLGACSGDSGRYPSLAVRPAERVEGQFAPPPPAAPPPAVLPAANPAELDRLLASAQAAHAEFLAAAPKARETVGRGSGATSESDAWSAAQVAVADLESRRSLTAVALGDADLLYADSALTGSAIAPIAEVRSKIAALIKAEDVEIAALRLQLSQ